jgi:hypothetical protein
MSAAASLQQQQLSGRHSSSGMWRQQQQAAAGTGSRWLPAQRQQQPRRRAQHAAVQALADPQEVVTLAAGSLQAAAYGAVGPDAASSLQAAVAALPAPITRTLAMLAAGVQALPCAMCAAAASHLRLAHTAPRGGESAAAAASPPRHPPSMLCCCCRPSLPHSLPAFLPADVTDLVALQPTVAGVGRLAALYYTFFARPSPAVGARACRLGCWAWLAAGQ